MPNSKPSKSRAMKAIFEAIVAACGFGSEYVKNSISTLQKRLGVDAPTATMYELLNWEGDLSREEIEKLLADAGTDYQTVRGQYDQSLAAHRGSLVG